MIIWLASYPKSGNTWVRLFLNSLIFAPDVNIDINNISLGQFPTRKYFREITDNIDDVKEFIHNCSYAQSKLNLDNKIKFFKTHNAFWKIGNHSFTNDENTKGIIHIVRDGRDVITSFHPSKPNEYFVAPQQWVKLVKSGLKWKQHPSVLTLKYEDLILKKENTMVLLLDFLALDASPKMLNFPLYTTLKQPNSLMDKVSDLNAKSINKWKRLNHDKRIAMFNGIDEAVRLNSKLGY